VKPITDDIVDGAWNARAYQSPMIELDKVFEEIKISCDGIRSIVGHCDGERYLISGVIPSLFNAVDHGSDGFVYLNICYGNLAFRNT